MFEVKCNGRLLCISPTFRGAEQYIKKIKKKDILFNIKNEYKIIEEELTV